MEVAGHDIDHKESLRDMMEYSYVSTIHILKFSQSIIPYLFSLICQDIEQKGVLRKWTSTFHQIILRCLAGACVCYL